MPATTKMDEWRRRLDNYRVKLRDLDPVTRETVDELIDEFDRILDDMPVEYDDA